jgi:hypothetical protein
LFSYKLNIILGESSACIFVVEENTMEDYVDMYVCTEGDLELNILFQCYKIACLLPHCPIIMVNVHTSRCKALHADTHF